MSKSPPKSFAKRQIAASVTRLRQRTVKPVAEPDLPASLITNPKGQPRMPTAALAASHGGQPKGNGHAPQHQVQAATPTVSAVFGEIVWLMTQSIMHRSMFLSDLEWMVMPPLMLGQFRLFHGPDPLQDGHQRPIGCIVWALAVPEVAVRLATGITRMRPQDWRPVGLGGHGDMAAQTTDAVVWIVDCLAPFGGTQQMINDFRGKVFPGREVKWRSVGDKAETRQA